MADQADREAYKYWAFISYSHQDKAWASWLHRALETYRVPRRLVGREHWSGAIPRRLLPVFRDRDELSSSAELGTVLNEALRQSRHLIVICSPQAANSRWVNEEIKTFKAMGRSARVLPIIVGGEPDVSQLADKAALECLPAALRFEVDGNGELTDRRAEPIAADARGGQDGRRNARLKLIAGLIGVGLDELKQRERQRQVLQRFAASAAVIALTLSATAGWRWQQDEKQQALDAQALKVRIEQLYEKGRQELLAHNEARAAVYLNEAYKLGVDTPALRFMLSRAMRVVDAQVLRVQTGNDGILVSLSPDGTRFLTLGQDPVLRIWDAVTGKPLFHYDRPEGSGIVSARFSPGGRWIWVYTYVHSDDSLSLRVLDANTGQLIKAINPGGMFRDASLEPIDVSDRWLSYVKGDGSIAIEELGGSRSWLWPGKYSAVHFCGDQPKLITGAESGGVDLRGFPDGNVLRHYSGLGGAVLALDASAGCKELVAGSSLGELRWWNADDGTSLMIGGHTQSLADVHLSSDGSRLSSQTKAGISVWSRHNGALLYAAKFFDPKTTTAQASPQQTLLAVTAGPQLLITDPASGETLYTLDGHQGGAYTFGFGSQESQLISTGADGSTVLWHLPERRVHEYAIGSPTAGRLAVDVSGIFDHSGDAYFYWSDEQGGELRGAEVWQTAEGVSAAAFAPGDRTIAVAQSDKKLVLRDAHSGALIEEWPALERRIASLSFNAQGSLISVLSKKALNLRHVELRRIPGGQLLAGFDIDWPKAHAFSPSGETFAVGLKGAVSLWDAAHEKNLWSTQLPSGESLEGTISALLFSPDGKTLIAVQAQRHVYLLDAADGKVLKTADLPMATGQYLAAISADGRHVALGDFSKAVFVWSPESGDVQTLLGHGGQIMGLAFSPDGTLLLSAGADGLVKIWDVARQELIESVVVQEGAVNWYSASINSDGGRAIIGGTDGTVKLFNMHQERRDPEQIEALLRCRVPWRVTGTELLPAAPEFSGCSMP